MGFILLILWTILAAIFMLQVALSLISGLSNEVAACE